MGAAKSQPMWQSTKTEPRSKDEEDAFISVQSGMYRYVDAESFTKPPR